MATCQEVPVPFGDNSKNSDIHYPLTSGEITRLYDTVISQDRDLNGTPDLLEDAVLPAPRPFMGIPFAITGAIEAEQFDLGGPGVAYSTAGGNYWTNDYRPSAIEITNCNDLGHRHSDVQLRHSGSQRFYRAMAE